MRIGSASGQGTSLALLEAFRRANVSATVSAERISTSQRINRAGDDPTGIVELAHLQSQYNEAVIRARLASSPVNLGAYQTIGSTLQGILDQATTAKTAMMGGDSSKLAGVIAALRGAAATAVNGTMVFAGDPLHREEAIVHHNATSGGITGTTITGSVVVGGGSVDTGELVNDAQTTRLTTPLTLNNSNNRKNFTNFTITQESVVRITNSWNNGSAGSTEIFSSSGTRIASSSYHGSPYNDTFDLVLQAGTYKVQANGDIFNDTTANIKVTAGTVRRAVNFELDGVAHQIVMLPGTRSTLTQAVNDLKTAIEAQTSLKNGIDFSLSVVNNQVVAKSLKAGAGSTIDFTGTIADAMGLSGGPHNRGADAYDETIYGANKPLTVTYGGRSVTLDNLTKHADNLQAAVNSGDNTQMQTAIGAVVTALGLDKGEVAEALRLLTADADAFNKRAEYLKSRLDFLQHVDVPAETNNLSKSQLQAQQAAWAIQFRNQHQTSQAQMLFGGI